MNYNAKFCSNYFSVNVSALAVAFRRQILKNPRILPKIAGFLKFIGETQQLVQKRLHKNN